MFEERMTEYLHLPLKILWFDVNEWTIFGICYVLAMKVGGVTWFSFFLAKFFIIPMARECGRGVFKHVLYEYGWIRIKGYPSSMARVFYE